MLFALTEELQPNPSSRSGVMIMLGLRRIRALDDQLESVSKDDAVWNKIVSALLMLLVEDSTLKIKIDSLLNGESDTLTGVSVVDDVLICAVQSNWNTELFQATSVLEKDTIFDVVKSCMYSNEMNPSFK